MAEVLMPQLGETVTEGTITRWLKQVGEPVERDEPLFEVSTDKVDSEVPAPAGGTVNEILVPEGATVDVGTLLAVIADGADGALPPGPGPAAAAEAPAPPVAPSAPVAPPSPPAVPPVAPPVGAPVPPPPVVAPAAPVPPSAPFVAAATSPTPPPDGLPVVGVPGGADPGRRNGGLVLSPVVRRLLGDNAVDPSQVPGTGVGGRITRADVLAFLDARRTGSVPGAAGATAAPVSPPPAAPTGPLQPAVTAEGVGGPVEEDLVVPFTNIRRRTAEHMVRSQETSAHTLVAREADFEQVDRVRRAFGAEFKAQEGFSLTYLPFIARAVVEALRGWPNLNASVGDDALVLHRRVHLAIAVDLSFEGLVAPVVHGADELTVRGLARRIADLAGRARAKQLGPDDLAGGTFTITNPGPYGTFMTIPIINQPQVAILSTDGVRRRPVVVEGADGTESVGIRSVGMLALSFDHRAVDGAYAAGFVASMTEMLAEHDWAAEL